MKKKLRLFFEFKVPVVSYFILAVVIFCLHHFNIITQKPLTTFNAQIGGIILFSGLLLRTITTSTIRNLNNNNITGIYALCRQPLLLSQFIIFTGLNVIILNVYFMVLSLLVFFANDCLLARRYDKILSHYHKKQWITYTKHTNFVIPTLSKITHVLIKQNINPHKTNDNKNIWIFLSIYCILTEIATISNL